MRQYSELPHDSDALYVRDPIHGPIALNKQERLLIEHPAFQRLRHIKQLGFADVAFPAAVHSRFIHSIGALHVATRLFDRLLPPQNPYKHDEEEKTRLRLRQTVRLAMLLHDVGHAPLSHTTEMRLPLLKELALEKSWGLFQEGKKSDEKNKRATHEDFTLKIILDSSLGQQIDSLFGDSVGIYKEHVALLILSSLPTDVNPATSSNIQHSTHSTEGLPVDVQQTWFWRGKNCLPLLRQIISSECDADRMDYLQRDSLFSGVNFGKFDADWLIDNVVPVDVNGVYFLGIRSRAIFSFEDFLLSRYHMFATVYLHEVPVIYEKMLSRYFTEAPDEFSLPASIDEYIKIDDMNLWMTLRKSKNEWARRIVEQKPYVLLDERHDASFVSKNSHQAKEDAALSHQEIENALAAENIPLISTQSKSVLSKYFGSLQKHAHKNSAPIYAVTGAGQRLLLEQQTPLFERYKRPALVQRIYVAPESEEKARRILRGLHQQDVNNA